MASIEPGSDETLAMTVATGVSLLLVLGLLVTLLVWHRAQARRFAPAPDPWRQGRPGHPVGGQETGGRPWGLFMLAALAAVPASFATSTEFIRCAVSRESFRASASCRTSTTRSPGAGNPQTPWLLPQPPTAPGAAATQMFVDDYLVA